MSESLSVERAEIVKKFGNHETDCGSPEVQVALLTDRLESLTKHLQKHPQDTHSQRGMMKIISRRKALLQYLKDTNVESYRKTVSALGLRK